MFESIRGNCIYVCMFVLQGEVILSQAPSEMSSAAGEEEEEAMPEDDDDSEVVRICSASRYT